MDSCMRAYSTVQQLLCHGSYCELILSLARTSCRLLFTTRPTARPLAGNPLRDAVRSRNPSKSTLAHDTVATRCCASIIRSSALVQASSSLSIGRTCTWPREDTGNENAISPLFARVFSLSHTNTPTNEKYNAAAKSVAAAKYVLADVHKPYGWCNHVVFTHQWGNQTY